MLCPAGHDVVSLTDRLVYCELCDMAFSQTGDILTWEACPHTQELAQALCAARQREVLFLSALRDAVHSIDHGGDAVLARTLLEDIDAGESQPGDQ